MPTQKIGELPKFPFLCEDPDHNPPTMRVFEPGIWEHTCPTCNHKQKFIIYSTGILKDKLRTLINILS